MSGVPAEQDETTDYRTTRQAKGKGQRAKDKGRNKTSRHRDNSTGQGRGQSSAGVRLARISRLRKNDRRTYGEVTGVIWLQTSCQPVGIFAKTMLAWNWPLVALPLYCPFSVTRLIATATSPPYTRIFMSGSVTMVSRLVAPDFRLARRSALVTIT